MPPRIAHRLLEYCKYLILDLGMLRPDCIVVVDEFVILSVPVVFFSYN